MEKCRFENFHLVKEKGKSRHNYCRPELKKQRILPPSKVTQEQMRSKVLDIYRSGKCYKDISTAFGLQ